MSHHGFSRAVLRSVLALAAVTTLTPAAGAAFTVMVNGVIVATDQGAGDRDADTGVIEFVDTVGSHQIRLTALIDPSRPGVTLSELQVTAAGEPGDPAGALRVSVTGTFAGGGFDPAGDGRTGLRSSATRNRVGGSNPGGSVGAFAAATGSGGRGEGAVQTPTVLLDRPVDADEAAGLFSPPGGEFELTQTVFVTGLVGGDGLTVTAAADVTGLVASNDDIVPVDRLGEVFNNPAPAGAVLVLAGLPVLAVFRRRLLGKR
ncbi:MAG: hypothetical protein C0501_01240 [Isosphaera sp.]|nr:hypothetical protein [Isosphaera sp.]